ncbi:MAG: recombinase family protein [Nanoarchaeota archaeon]
MDKEILELRKKNELLKKEIEELKSKLENQSVLRGKTQKEGMVKRASQGGLMSRSPFGYKIENKKLVPAENHKEIEEIFEEFLNQNISLRNLAKKHNLSVNGLKKILKNFTYIGKIKFNNQVHNGNHQAIISSTLFNHVQNKLERLGIK